MVRSKERGRGGKKWEEGREGGRGNREVCIESREMKRRDYVVSVLVILF